MDDADPQLLPRRNVVLTGFMGTGKTTIGRLVAARLGYEFVDTDVVIEAEHGPIPQIFAEHGEGEFRRLEREVAKRLSAATGLVVSTGGRMMVDPVNARCLSATGIVFCLTASVDTILARVTADGSHAIRPMLAGDDVRTRVTELLAERSSAYESFRQVATDRRSPDEIAEIIVGAVGREGVTPGAGSP
jgi:shikimate kinase